MPVARRQGLAEHAGAEFSVAPVAKAKRGAGKLSIRSWEKQKPSCLAGKPGGIRPGALFGRQARLRQRTLRHEIYGA